MMFSFILIVIGVLLAMMAWKMIKFTFKHLFAVIVVGLIIAVLFPHALMLAGGLAGMFFLLIGLVGTFLVLGIFSLFFWRGD